MEGVILIASSYRIIKSNQRIHQEETQIASIDLTTYQPKEESFSSYVTEEEEPISQEETLKRAIRLEVEEELQIRKEEFMLEVQEEFEAFKITSREEGLAQGMEEGILQGRQEIYRELDVLRLEAVNKVLEAEQLAKTYLEEHEERILKLAAKIAEKIIHVSLDQHEDSLMILARPILEEYGKTENVIISCHPEKVSFIKEYLPEMEKLCPNARILVLEDRNLSGHDMIIENESQITDLTISRQIERFLELATG